MATETGWLIEWQAPDGARWLTVEKCYDFSKTIFEKDAGAALRFSRREDAESFIDLNRRDLPAGVWASDHMWCDPPEEAHTASCERLAAMWDRKLSHFPCDVRCTCRTEVHSQSDAGADSTADR